MSSIIALQDISGGNIALDHKNNDALIQVALDKEGRVSEFFLKSEDTENYRTQRETLKDRLGVQATECERLSDMGRPSTIRYVLCPAMETSDFLRAAISSGVVSRREALKVNDAAGKLYMRQSVARDAAAR